MSRQDNLGAIRLFAGFGDDEIDGFVDAAVRRAVPAGHVFFRMGDLNSSLFIVCAGSVKVERLGTADDIANAVLFLDSEAGAYINGHELVVDGGVLHSLLDQLPRE